MEGLLYGPFYMDLYPVGIKQGIIKKTLFLQNIKVRMSGLDNHYYQILLLFDFSLRLAPSIKGVAVTS